MKKIVQGQFHLFEEMYKPFLEEYEAKNLLRFSSAGDKQVNIFQVPLFSKALSLVASLPWLILLNDADNSLFIDAS